MSPTFIAVVFVIMLLLAFWRLALMVLAAVLLAVIAVGLGLVPTAAGLDQPPPWVEQPLDPSDPGYPLTAEPPG